MNRNPLVLLLAAFVSLGAAAGVLALTGDDGSSELRSAPTVERAPSTSSSPEPSPSPTPSLSSEGFLLPNMRSLPARGLRIQRTGEGRLLRFSAHLANYGPGPLLLRPRLRAPGCPAGQHPAAQRLHRDGNADGRYQRRRDNVAGPARGVGCMIRHRRHDHWHFDAMARYTLRLADTGRVINARDKVSFCLRDNRRASGAAVVARRQHFGDCTRRSRQGISPGWVDVYESDLPGQSLTVQPGLGGKLLCLELEADPGDVLVETEESDNASAIGLRIRGAEVRRASPARC